MKRRSFLSLPIIGAIVGMAKQCFGVGQWTATIDGTGRVYTDEDGNGYLGKNQIRALEKAHIDKDDVSVGQKEGRAVAYFDPHTGRWEVVLADGSRLIPLSSNGTITATGWSQEKGTKRLFAHVVGVEELRIGKPPNDPRL